VAFWRKKRPPALRRRRRKSVNFPGLLKLRAAEGAFKVKTARPEEVLNHPSVTTAFTLFNSFMESKKNFLKKGKIL
jgi:hypothetical protein